MLKWTKRLATPAPFKRFDTSGGWRKRTPARHLRCFCGRSVTRGGCDRVRVLTGHTWRCWELCSRWLRLVFEILLNKHATRHLGARAGVRWLVAVSSAHSKPRKTSIGILRDRIPPELWAQANGKRLRSLLAKEAGPERGGNGGCFDTWVDYRPATEEKRRRERERTRKLYFTRIVV